jgi:S1-C subfamily serine protease
VEILRQKSLWILLAALVSGLATYLTLKRIPELFVSEAVILVESNGLPAKDARAETNESLDLRLPAIAKQVMSGTRLEKIILTNDLYPQERKTFPIERVVEGMRQNIGVRVAKSGEGEKNSIFLTYSSNDPRVVQKVLGDIASLFIEENLKAREVITSAESVVQEGRFKDTGDAEEKPQGQDATPQGLNLRFTILKSSSPAQTTGRSHRLVLNLYGVLGGLAFGLVLAITVGLLSKTVTSERELIRLTNLPILASIPTIHGNPRIWLPWRIRNVRR